MNNLFRLDNKVVLITGAGQNIGQGLALALGLSGAHIAILDIDEEKATSTQNLLQAEGIKTLKLTADVTDPHQVDKSIEKILTTWSRLDIAINNVGMCFGGNSEDMDLSDWRKIMNVNLDSTFYNCQQQFKAMKSNSYGKIINIASVAGVLVPHPQKISAYNTAKAALIHLTRSLAAEWIVSGIRVNAISPGTIHIPAFDKEEMSDLLNNWQQQVPIGRLAKISDLFGAAIFLASAASDYIIGQNLIIDGGHTLW